MSITTAAPPVRAMPLTGNVDRLKTDPAYQAYTLLRIGFAVAPIAFGIDKFFNVMVNWEKYLAPWIHRLSPLSATHTIEHRRRNRDRRRHRRRDQTPLRRLPRRRLARRHHHQPTQLLRLLRRRATRLRTHARPPQPRATRQQVRPPQPQLPPPQLATASAETRTVPKRADACRRTSQRETGEC
jgi:hypothetical protein